MRKKLLGFLVCSLLSLGVVGLSARPSVVAQESGKAAKAEKGEGAKKKAARSGDRLPDNYGNIGVSEEQRKKIYEIQNKCDDQVAALQKQIADLRAKEASDLESVLTPEQKKSLQAAIEESKKKKAEKKKSSEKEKASDKSEKSEK